MKTQRFEASLLEGPKEAALEVPFDPAEVWSQATRHLAPGRWGHLVQGSINGVRFESAVVPRSGKYYLLVDDALRQSAGLAPGLPVPVVIEPRRIASASRTGAASRRGRKKGTFSPEGER